MQSFQLGTSKSFDISHMKANISPCVGCVTRSNCLHNNLDMYQLEVLTGEYTHKFKVRAGDALFHNGDPIHSIYTVRAGFLKLEFSLPNGQHQVTRFASPGDLLGADGIADGKHHLDAFALTDGEVCGLNFTRLQALMKEEINLQKSIECAMSHELNRAQEHLFSLGSHSVEQKLAYFLLDLLQKIGRRHSGLYTIHLPMNRDDLKSYLGVTTESLSRALTCLENKNCFNVKNREISNINHDLLVQILEPTNAH